MDNTSATRSPGSSVATATAEQEAAMNESIRSVAQSIYDQKGSQPTALEVIEKLSAEKNSEIPSAYMKGHISKQIIEDTFLVDAHQKFPESTIRINCEPHNAPAVFFSKQQNAYKCFKCLVGEQDLVYIDKRFKKEMEDFESIKEFTMKAVVDNA